MTQPDVIRQSELINQLVLDRRTMAELGRVELVWAYPQLHKVLGFICKSGFLGAKKSAFKLNQIDAIGSNGVLTQAQPEATDAEKVKQLDLPIHCEVWSNTGNKIGKIVDYLFKLKTGTITEYLFVSNDWSGITGEIYRLLPRQILSFGHRRVLVAESTIQSFALHQAGIKQKVTDVGDALKEDYAEVANSVREKLPTIAEQAKGRLQLLSDRAKARAQMLSQQAKEKAQMFNEQLQEETQVWVEQAKQRSQTFAEQVEDGFQTLTVQAKEILDVEETLPAPPSTHSKGDLDDLNDWLPLETPPHSVETGKLDEIQNEIQRLNNIEAEQDMAASAASISQSQATAIDPEDDDIWGDVDPPSAMPTQPPEPNNTQTDDDDDEPWI